MRDIPSRFKSITALIIATVLAGCSSPPPRQVIQQPLPVVGSRHRTADADQLLAQAELVGPPESVRLTIEAAGKLLIGQTHRARSILENIDYELLPPELQARLSLLRAEIAERNGQNWEVFNWLDREPVINSNNQALITRSHILRAKAFNRYGEYLAALDEWLSALPNIESEQQTELYKEFWNTLLHVPHDRLLTLNNQSSDDTLKGWLELALIYSPGETLDRQLENLSQWQQLRGNHPASQFLPENLDALNPESIRHPQKIALLLPTSGPLATAGRSVRDGFMAAYYLSINESSTKEPSVNDNSLDSNTTQEVFFLDTYKADIIELAQQAKDMGAELIVGPLDKSNAVKLKESPPSGVTVLVLNYTDNESGSETQNIEILSTNTGNTDTGFYQFGLSTEDEARLVAQRGILDGHRRTLIFTSKPSWSQRAVHSFTNEFEELEGEVADIKTFDNKSEYSKLAGEALLVDESQQRARKISSLLRERIGYEPRRRQDVDMIFIATSPEEARQIKPALAYQFAADIPAYATSNAYAGKIDRSRDQDLNFLRLPVMQWYVPGYQSPLKNIITDTWSSAQGQYGGLFALGADSFNLHPKLQQLRSLTGSRVTGLTGWLSIDEQGRIRRELSWQIFRNGRLTPLPIPVQNKDVLATQSTE